ncbi:MAG: hypothetical protein RJA81_1486, partial [Planctomycetota bacterium]
IAYDGPKQGGHVTPGGIFYRGSNFPSEFQHVFIGGNLLSNAVYWHKLSPIGSTVKGTFGGTLIQANDPWFRAIDVLTGPDDAVYVVDWYDKRASHLDPRDNWDKTNGRIYRISYGKNAKLPKYDLTTESDMDLIERLDGPSDFFARQAREELLFRDHSAITAKLVQGLTELNRSDETRLNLLWVLGSVNRLDDSLAKVLVQDRSAVIREWTIRFLGNENHLNRALADLLEELAMEETSPAVRLQLAASCRRWPTGMMLPILDKLTVHDSDLSDTMIPLTLWWTVQSQYLQNPDVIMAWLKGSEVRQRPILRDFLMPRMARMMVAMATKESWTDLWKIYEKGALAEQSMIIREMEQGASPASLTSLTDDWREILEKSAEFSSVESSDFQAALKFGFPKAAGRAGELVINPETPVASRIILLKKLTTARFDGLGQVVSQILSDKKSPENLVSEALTSALSVNDSALGEIILGRFNSWSPALQAKAITALANRPSTALALLKAMESGQIDRKRLTSAQAATIDRLGDESLSRLLEKVWGKPLRPTSEARIKRIAEIRGILPEGDKGVAARGKAVFLKNCATCHQLFGDGMALGPELNGADRGNLDFLLTSILDPSAQIRGEYQAVQVAMKDGRVLLGLIADKNDQGLTLIDANRQLTRISNNEIEEVKASSVSLMPEGILDTLKDSEIRDLFRYLQSPAPPKS